MNGSLTIAGKIGRKFHILVFTLCIAFHGMGYTQSAPRLTLEDALRIGVENNLNLQISSVQEEIATNNNTLGNAGYLPILSTSGNFSLASNNTKQEFFNGDSRSASDAGSRSAGANVGLDWTIFEGFRREAARDRLGLLVSRSKESTRAQAHELASSIELGYYELVRLQQQISLTEQSIQLNIDLSQLANQKLEIGVGTELDVLQAISQVNTDSSLLLAQLGILDKSMVSFNRLLGRSTDIPFSVDTILELEALPGQVELIELAVNSHPDLKLLQMDERITELQIKEAKSALYPTLEVNADYNYNWSRADVGFLLSNRSFGPVIGLRATYDVFSGRNLRKDIENVELLQRTFQLGQQDLEEALSAQIAAVYTEYRSLVDLQSLEQRNIETAERNTYLAQELYRLGETTNFEVREAILQEVALRDRLIETEYRMKLAQIELRRLSGQTL
ncbi:MAG: TolC family protein [Saprospiraceae bacterium]|nr:TolC family protein [Saprospiraceae bacterium]